MLLGVRAMTPVELVLIKLNDKNDLTNLTLELR